MLTVDLSFTMFFVAVVDLTWPTSLFHSFCTVQNPPMLTSFDLSLSLPEQLTLNFDASVDPSTCMVQLLTLQNSTTFVLEGSLIPNMDGTCTAGASANSINVMLTAMDWQMLQGNIYLATGASDTFLYALPGFIQDLDGVGSAEVTGLQVRTFTPDPNPPMLITGGLDFSMGSLGLIFDKAIVLNSIVPTGVTLSFMNMTTNSMGSLTLSDAEQFGYFELGSQIFITLILSEFFPLKLTSAEPYRVSITAGSFTDVFGVANVAQNDIELFNVAPDFDSPVPADFSLDMDSATLIITFQEPIGTSPGDYDLSLVYLTGTFDINSDDAYNLTNSVLTSSEFYSSILTFTISPTELNQIKLDPGVCTSSLNCFLIANDSSFVDTEGNIAMATITPVTNFIPDTTQPELVAYSIDLNEGLLMLNFTEPLVVDTIDFSLVNIYGPGGSGTPVNLAGNDVNSTEYDTIFLIALAPDTLNPIKSLATTGSVSLAISANVATDTSGNSLIPIPSANALAPSQYIPDTTPPTIIGFIPGYPEERRITLVFDEYVDPSTWNGNQFTLVLTTRQGQFEYPGFTQGTVPAIISDQLVYSFSATEFVMPFSDQYVNAYYQGLIILEPDAGLIADVSGNIFSGMSIPLVYRNNTLPPDTDSPTLMSFTLDLNMGSLSMTFSEAVTILAAADQVTLQDTPTSPVNSYTLMENGTLTTILASEFITIVLSMTDLNNIKSNPSLGTLQTNTYLVANELFAMDLFGNLLENITVGLQASSVIADTQRPIATSFKVDINSGQVTFVFSEPMSSSSIDLSQVYLGGTAQNLSPQYNLSGGSLLATEVLSTRFVFSIQPNVLRMIKFDTSVCTGLENCFLFLTATSFSDISGNQVVPVTTGLSPTEFTADMGSPQLMTYIIDLNAGTMRLTFSEPTDTAGFNPNGITLSSSEPGMSVMPSDAFITSVTNLNTVLTLTLGTMSLNNVKVLRLSPGDLQLTLASTTIMDTAGNPVLAIPNETPLLPEVVLIDLTPPTLRAFTPNPLSERRFTFLFDEYILASSWDGNQLFITFSSAQGSREYTPFISGTVTPMYSDTINYTFTSAEFVPPLSTDYTNAFTAGSFSLRTSFNWVQDLGFNPLPAITTPIRFTNDTNRPTLSSYTLDLNAGTLTLTFSEAVSINTVVNQVRFQNTASSPTSVYSLASNGTLSVSPGAAAMTITITLGPNDINSIKFNQALATTVSNTYLVVLESFASDISGNPLVGVQTGLQATNVIADNQGPMVTSTAVDLNNGMVSFRFNEPVSQTVDLSQLYITGTAQTSPGGYSLTGSTVTSITEMATLVTIGFSQAALNMIKVDSQVCSSRTDCFIYYTASSFSDVSGNQVVPSSPAVGVSNFTEDATSPELISYTVDLNQGQLILTFSEATNGMVNPFGITLLGTAPGSGSITLDFTVNTTFQMSNTILTFRLDSARLNQLKVISSMGQVGLAMQSITIYDNNNIPVVAILMTSPLVPSSVIPDTTPPTLLTFIPGYPAERRMTLVFDEFVSPATWNGNQVTLTLTTVQGANNYTSFTQGSLSTTVSDRIVYSFSAGEFSQFSDKYMQAYYEGTVGFLARSGLISDVGGNIMAAITTPLIFQNTSSTFTDTPALASFELDMNNGRLLLTFSEDIIVSAVSGQVQLQNALINPSQSYTLMREGTISSTAISTVLTLTLDPFDLNNIKSTQFLATSMSDSFLLIRNGFGRDTMNNFFNSSLNGAVQAAVFIEDTTPPRLASFDLYNDDNGSMILSFDEPINIGSVDVTRITLLGGPNSPATYTLTDGQYIDLTGGRLSLLFILTQSDVAAIRQVTGLAENADTTYVVVGTGMCRDLAGNQIQQVPNASPIPVSMYIADTGAASLQSFTLDMNFGVLSLTFNDIIDVATVNVSRLTIQNSSSSVTSSYSLTSGRMISPTSSNIIIISLEYTDWNALRSLLNLATSRDNTYISFPATFANTVGGAPLLGIPATSAQRVTMYTPDTQRLQLSFYTVNLNEGLIHFEFLEPVLVSSANPTAIQIQNAVSSPTAVYRLTGGTVTTSSLTSLSLDVMMSLDDLLALNGMQNLAKSTANTYISYIGNFVNDTNGNTLLPIVVQVSSFIADVAPPQLLYFDANLTGIATLTLQFSKGVQFLDGSQGSFTLQNSQSNAQVSLTFNSMETITQPTRETLVITLRSDYLMRLQTSNDIGASADQLFITLSAGGVSDYFGNQAVAIPPTNAQRVRYICKFV